MTWNRNADIWSISTTFLSCNKMPSPSQQLKNNFSFCQYMQYLLHCRKMEKRDYITVVNMFHQVFYRFMRIGNLITRKYILVIFSLAACNTFLYKEARIEAITHTVSANVRSKRFAFSCHRKTRRHVCGKPGSWLYSKPPVLTSFRPKRPFLELSWSLRKCLFNLLLH